MDRSRRPINLSCLGLVVSLGLVCQITQVVLLREFLVVFHGNELTFGVILGAWMIWVGAGSRWAGAVRVRPDSVAVQTISAAVVLVLPLTVFAIRLLRAFSAVQPGGYLSVLDMLVSAFLLTAPAGLLLGAQFVLLSRAWRVREQTTDTTAAGKAYLAEAVGHAAGGALFALVLVHLLNSFEAVVSVALVMALAAFHLARTSRRVLLLTAIALGAVCVPFLRPLDAWAHSLQWRSIMPGHELIAVRQSPHGAIAVLRQDDQYSFFQSGNLLFATVSTSTEAELEEQDAVISAHLAMAQHPDAQRILMIGGGLRGMVRELLRYPVAGVDYVELDPLMTRVALDYLPPQTVDALGRDEVRVHHGDGRKFIREAGDRYDLIFTDAPEPSTAVLNRYYTKEFFREAADRLVPGGILVVTAGSTGDSRGQEIANRNATIFHTLGLVFSEVLAIGERQLHFFAALEQGVLSDDSRVLVSRYLARGVTTPGFSPVQFDILLEQGPLRRVNWILRNHGRSDDAHLTPPATGPLFPEPVSEQAAHDAERPAVRERFFINSDFRPVGYFHTLAYWSQLTRSGHRSAFRLLIRVEPWWLLPPVALALIVAAVLPALRAKRPPGPPGRFPLMLAVFTTGLSTMTLQVGLLFAFQSVYGFVYEMVGLIIAAFMAGLALGTATTRRFVPDPADSRVLMLVQLAIAVCAALIALALPWSARVGPAGVRLALFFLVTFGAGFLNGVDFPLAAACCLASTGAPERATGRVYGMELFGACAGAIIAGVAVAPVLGIVACCLLASAANGTAFLALIIDRRSYARA